MRKQHTGKNYRKRQKINDKQTAKLSQKKEGNKTKDKEKEKVTQHDGRQQIKSVVSIRKFCSISYASFRK